MQIVETVKEGLKRTFVITVTAREIEATVNLRTEAARKDFNIQKMFGQSAREEVVQELIQKAMRGHFDGNEERPAFRPQIEMIKDGTGGQDLEVSMSYEVLPEIPKADFGSIKLERPVAKFSEEDLDDAFKRITASAAQFEARPEGEVSEEGDQVLIDFKGAVDGEAFDGGTAEDYPLVLGSGSFIPGFEEQLLRKQVGDEVEVMVAFPANYAASHLAGKDAVFTCLVKEVRQSIPAVLDDTLAQSFGANTLEGFREHVRERLTEELTQVSEAVLRLRLTDALEELVKFDVPPSLVEQEAGSIAHQRWHADHADRHDHDHPEITPGEDDIRLAERMVRLGMLLADIGDSFALRLTEAEVQQAVMGAAQQYPGQEKEFLDFLQKNPQALHQITGPRFEAKVVGRILELVEVTEVVVSVEELRRALQD